MKMRVADYIAQYLEKLGCRQAFLLAGGGMMHLMDAVGRREQLKYICNHHEHACAVAAEGYARKSGKLGACYATSGPGATNTVTGVAECWLDSVPVIFLTGQSKLSQTIRGSKIAGLRQFGTFEVDIVSMVESITKYAVFLDDAKKIRYHLEKACWLAQTGRPGPVLIDVPVDLQGALIEPETLEGFTPDATTESMPSDATIDQILDRLKRAKRPLILAGHGIRVANQADAFLRVAEKLNIPVATTQLALDLMPYDHPLYVGHPGMKGDRAGNFAVQSADVILVLGSSLHVLNTGYELDRFAPQAYKIQVDLDEAILKRESVGVNEKIKCSVQGMISRISERLAAKSSGNLFPLGSWQEACATWKKELIVRNEPHARQDGKINYYDIIEALSDTCKEGDTIVADAGSAFYVVGQAFRAKKSQRVLVSGALGAMGHALPMAIGASSADPKSRVICFVGDGSLQTNIQELATLAYNQLNVAVVVVSNDGYLSIRNTQRNFFGGFLVGTDSKSGVSMPNLSKMAEAYGLPFMMVERVEDLKASIEKAHQTRGPILCEVLSGAAQEIIPTVSSYKRDDGTMESKPLDEMYPFMSPEDLKKYTLRD